MRKECMQCIESTVAGCRDGHRAAGAAQRVFLCTRIPMRYLEENDASRVVGSWYASVILFAPLIRRYPRRDGSQMLHMDGITSIAINE